MTCRGEVLPSTEKDRIGPIFRYPSDIEISLCPDLTIEFRSGMR
jgi:hypothetical protein